MSVADLSIKIGNPVESNLHTDPRTSGNWPGAWPTGLGVDVSDVTCSQDECDRRRYARGLCRLHYGRASYAGTLQEHAPLPKLPPQCAVEGCTKPRLKQAKGHYRHCAAHNARLRRTGSVQADEPIHSYDPGPWLTATGYLEMSALSHPIVGSRGKARVHRIVLYDAIGPGMHPCHWCGTELRWDIEFPDPHSLTVDHLDGVRVNNDISNLVPSCHPCNAGRHPAVAS
jgi:hypothetical protein